MIGVPVLIGLDGFELHEFPANAADWESRFRGDRGVRDVGQIGLPARIIRLHKRPTPRIKGPPEGCVRGLLENTTNRTTELCTMGNGQAGPARQSRNGCVG